jgi:hypothetical protein
MTSMLASRAAGFLLVGWTLCVKTGMGLATYSPQGINVDIVLRHLAAVFFSSRSEAGYRD